VTLIYDLETNGLLDTLTTIHCGVVYEVETAITKMYSSKPLKGTDGTIVDMIEHLKSGDTLVGHNIIKFDNAVIEKLYGVDLDNHCKMLDTLILSKLLYPSTDKLDARRGDMPGKLRGKHSLGAWGYRTKTMKDDYDGGWEELTQEMFDYCRQDGVATNAIYERFIKQGLPPKQAIDLEQQFAKIIGRQEQYGVKFDIKAAQRLHIELEEEKERMILEVHKNFTPLGIFTKKNEIKNKYKKDGDKSLSYQRQLALGFYFDAKGIWGVDVVTIFNPGSRAHIVYWLGVLYDWKPKETTEKGNPIVNEGVLKSLEYPEAKVLAQYFNVSKLLGQLALGPQAWLKVVKTDGRIHGGVDTLGAVTRRCTHSRPNMAQVPSVNSFKGAECRALFIAGRGKKIVGCDASGLELRVLAHFMAKYDGGAYGKTILEGDIHTANQKAAGLPTRNNAKTFIYGFLYGAGAVKLGEIVGGGFKEGDRLKKRFLRKLPAIAKLGEAVVAAVKKTGTLKALDGNRYYIRSEHSALNVLLQGAGALVMKFWLIEYDKQLQKKWTPGKEYEFVLNIHDEAQVECDEDIAQEVGKIATQAFLTITKDIGFRIDLEGESKIGDTWYDTH